MKTFDDMTLDEKLDQVALGNEVEFTQEEADLLGALEETGLSEEEARETQFAPNIAIGVTELLDIPTFITRRLD